ncbi:MAG TPA: thiamine pyrophosphate-dependent enzyme [Polyangiaceae bacterium]|nr:thiamine pyrophosphate-dependent enzyme [Polyangiaceae bacterium]
MTAQGTSSDSDDVLRILRPDGTIEPGRAPGLTVAEVVELYRAMVRTRMLDERLVMLQRQGRIGFHIGSLGEEATVLGTAWVMRPQDFIFPCYREFGAALLRGMTLQSYLDNMFGNGRDLAKGRQMPDHITARGARFGSVSSPIGTQITHAVGYAWSCKLQRQDVVTLVWFGDGATSSSEFHNGMNFAGVYQVPALLVCRNNGWAISVPTGGQTASESIAEKGRAYGVRSVRCDGNDLFAVVAAGREAVARASRGEGPTFLEALTYRMSGHSTSDDPNAYRLDDELEPWKKRDPIARVRAWLVGQGAWDDGLDAELEGSFDVEVKAAIASAEEAARPELSTLFDDVYAQLPAHLREQRDQLLRGPRPAGDH